MEMTTLAGTGMQVSRLCFGTMTFGRESTFEECKAVFHRCRDAGINFLDTADVYSRGHSEDIVGRLTQDSRNDFVLATKAYFPMGDGPNMRGSSRLHLTNALHASLRRLRTDRVEIFYLHRYDPNVDPEQLMRTLDDFVGSGKVLSIGVSNFAAWQIMKALGISTLRGWASIQVVQPMYNLLKRQVEVEILPMCQSEGLAVVPYSPLAGGLLTGKYRKQSRPEGDSRLNTSAMYQNRYSEEHLLDTIDAFVQVAEEEGLSPVTLAIAWVMKNPAVTAPILGARNLEQLEPCLAAARYKLSDELYKRLSSLVPSPPPATDRLEEVKHGEML